MPLNPGDLVFVAVDVDEPEQIVIAATIDIAAGTTIIITEQRRSEADDFPSGGSQNGVIEWTVGAGGLSSGETVTFTNLDDATATGTDAPSASSGTLIDSPGITSFALSASNQILWILEGTTATGSITGTSVNASNYVALLSTEADSPVNVVPNLTGTGLTASSNGVRITDGDEDFMSFNQAGSTFTDRDAFFTAYNTASNWQTDPSDNPNGPGAGFPNLPTSFTIPVCFTRGTLLRCGEQYRRIEDLDLGQMVNTRDSGPQPLMWIGRCRVSHDELQASPNLYPVRIKAGALGNGLPTRDLSVSRQHRMLISSRITQKAFGEEAVLVPAIKLTELDGIDVDKSAFEVEYFHILLNEHEVVWAEDAPSESLYLGRHALKAMTDDALEEIEELFPEVFQGAYEPSQACALYDGKVAKLLVARHQKNHVPLTVH